MLATRGANIFTPVWKLPSDLHVEKNNSWNQAKEIYVQKNGSWNKVWNRNFPGPVGSQHPFWQYSINSEFNFTDDNICFGTFWSSPSDGSYAISSGVCTLYINSLNTVVTTQDQTLLTNTTSGSNILVLKDTNPLQPVTVSDVNGSTIRWSVSGTNIQSNTRVSSILNATEIQVSRNATGTASGLNIRYFRSYISGYSGLTRMTSNKALLVSPGQTYRIRARTTNGTTGGSGITSWSIGGLTGSTPSQADILGGGGVFETSRFTDISERSVLITIPSGHSYLRPFVTILHEQGSYPTVMPRFYSFNYIRVTREG